MAGVRQSTALRLSLGTALLALATSCTLPGTQTPLKAGRPGAQLSATVVPPKVTVSPADGAQGVALDAPVEVSASSGRIDSVSVSELGTSAAPAGELAPGARSWHLSGSLDPGASYVVTAHVSAPAGQSASAHATFHTLKASGRLLTSVTPDDGAVVGVGEPIDLTFNVGIPAERRAALLERIHISSTPGTVGAWHWFSNTAVHFRPRDYWAAGTQVVVAGDLKGFDAGAGVWGLGNWSSSFTVGEKHVSVIDDNTHQMQVFQNDQPIDTWPVSLGKAGFRTLQGTLLVLYHTYKVYMDSCSTFGGAACIPGAPNYYRDWVYYDTAVSSDGYFIHAAPWSVYAQGHYDVSHGCVNLSTAHATTFYNFSQVGDVVIIKNTGSPATYSDGEGDWQIDFNEFPNTAGLNTVWTGAVAPGLPGTLAS